ncbi:MAG: metallopeptidase TldD-related protein [Nitrospirota bacterium]|nr:metallopeptidase TldD-related protein [Nitrospirota bacterium]
MQQPDGKTAVAGTAHADSDATADINLERITRALRQAPGVSGWVVQAHSVDSHQLYRVFRGIQAMRASRTRSVQITVHTRTMRDGKEVQGEAGFTVTGPDPRITPAHIARAVERAGLVANPPWTLPGAASVAALELEDPRIAADPRAVIADLTVEMDRAAGGSSSRSASHSPLCASELFAERHRVTVCTSEGFEASYRATDLFAEFVLLAGSGSESVECLGIRRARRPEELDLGGTVERHARWVADRLRATLPATATLPVVFGEEALDTLFDAFLSHAGARSRYEGWSRLTEGKSLLGGNLGNAGDDLQIKGDPLTLGVDPLMPWMHGSHPFDADGQPCTPVTVVERGRFVRRTASRRFADYLGIPATGSGGNTVVATGGTPLADLLADGPVLHALRFSTFHPNAITGSFSGELRTAYLVGKDGSVQPVVGGSVSGNVWTAFADAHFSTETAVRAAYRGPAGVRLEGVTVAGGAGGSPPGQ